MTARIREFLRNRQADHQDDVPCLVVDLDVVRDNYQNFAKALPDTRVFYAVKANPAPEVLSLLAALGSCFDTASVPEIEMALAAGAVGGPHLLRQHDQEGARHRPRLCARRAPLCGRLPGRGREDRPRRAGQPRVLPHPVRLRRGGMAAVAEVRLRAGHGGRRARARLSPRPRALRRVVPCRLPAAQPACLGPRARLGGRGVPRLRRARHEPRDGEFGRRLPDQVPQERADGAYLRCVDLPRAAAPFRQPHPGDHRRAGPRHGRQCRRHRGRGRARLEEERERRRALGLSRHRQVRRPRRDDGRVRSATRSVRRATATARSARACSPVRPATRPT